MNFNYIEHYKIDAEKFDYFENRPTLTLEEENRVHKAILEKIEDSDLQILDVGSGNGWLSKIFSDKKNIFSSDISIKNLQKIKERDNNDLTLVSDALNLPFKENSFDCIVASEIIEHTINPKIFIQRLIGKLKPNGKLIVTTPYKEKIRYTLCVHCNQTAPINAHLHSFDENNFKDFTSNEVFELENVYKFGNKALNYFYFYHLIDFLPFSIWKRIDAFANKIIKMPLHILVVYKKKNG